MTATVTAADPEEQDRTAAFGFAATIVAALATTLMLEAARVFFSYTVFVIDQAKRAELGAIALGVFAAFALGGVGARLIGPRWFAVVCLLDLAAARLVLQFVDEPRTRMVCGALTLVAWGWLLPSLRALAPNDTARGVVYGLLIDLALRFAFGSVDLPWMPGALRHATAILLVVAMLGFAIRLIAGERFALAAGAGPSLIGVGPGLAVYGLMTGNLGLLEARTDLPIQAVTLLAALGLAAGFAVQIRPADPTKPGPAAPAIAAVLLFFGELALWVFWRWNGVPDLLLVLVAGVAAQLLTLSLRGRGELGVTPSIGHDALWLTLGMLVYAAIVFAYYSATGLPPLIGVALALLGLGAALAAGRGRPLPAMTSGRYLPGMAAAAALLLLVALGVNRSAWRDVDRPDTLPSTLTVMTYNVQTGFSRDNEWSLERTARVIEAQNPDVVLLQEVSRGWMVTSGVDEARWLSRRLDMNLAWGPSSRDGLWGVAILSKGRIITAEMYRYTSTENLRRGVLGAAIDAEAGPLYVYSTHLDNPSDAAEVRLKQTQELLAVTNGKSPAITGGDFNATPDSDVHAAMLAAGYVDAGAALPPEATTSEGGHRIDYLYLRGPFTVTSATVPDAWVSDHRPFVAVIQLT